MKYTYLFLDTQDPDNVGVAYRTYSDRHGTLHEESGPIDSLDDLRNVLSGSIVDERSDMSEMDVVEFLFSSLRHDQ